MVTIAITFLRPTGKCSLTKLLVKLFNGISKLKQYYTFINII